MYLYLDGTNTDGSITQPDKNNHFKPQIYYFKLIYLYTYLLAHVFTNGASQVVQWPMQEMKETQIQLLVPEDPPQEELATHPGILAWKIAWT